MKTFIDILSDIVGDFIGGHSKSVQMTQDDLDFFVSIQSKIERVAKEQNINNECEILNTITRLLSYHEERNSQTYNKEFENLIKEKSNLIPSVIEILNGVIENHTINSHRVYIFNNEELTVFTGMEEECRNKSRQLQEMLPDCECGYNPM